MARLILSLVWIFSLSPLWGNDCRGGVSQFFAQPALVNRVSLNHDVFNVSSQELMAQLKTIQNRFSQIAKGFGVELTAPRNSSIYHYAQDIRAHYEALGRYLALDLRNGDKVRAFSEIAALESVLDSLLEVAFADERLVKEDNGYSISIDPLFKDERSGPVYDARSHAIYPQTVYFSKAGAKLFEVFVDNGLFFQKDLSGNIDLVDTRDAMNPEREKAIFVQDRDENVFVLPLSRIDDLPIKHSSLVAGGGLRMAGEIIIHQGRLISITDRSGHYLPPRLLTRQFVEWLRKRAVIISDDQILMKSGAKTDFRRSP